MTVQSFVITVVILYIMTKYLIAVVGPTAIGKTALSIKIAQHFQTEIISADSRQFYKEMTHFEREAISLLQTLHKNNPYATMVGGSGMYVDAVIRGLDQFPEVKSGIREQLNTLFESEGIEALQHLLKEKDPVYYERVDIQNHQRVTRALEVCLSSGKPFSSFLDKPKPKRPFETIKIGLSADREVIYDRINKRVDIMVTNGLVEEVQGLLSRKRLNALQTVGYRELFEHFEGKISLEQAIENIKTNTRRFAKRQGTWYRKDGAITWFDYQTPFEEISEFIHKKTSYDE